MTVLQEMQERLDTLLLGRTVEKVDLDQQFTYEGTNIIIKLIFDNGSSILFGLQNVPDLQEMEAPYD